MNSFDYKFGKIVGELELFAFINSKTNNLYSFEIFQITHEQPLEIAIEKFIKHEYFVYKPESYQSLTLAKIEDWKYVLSNVLKNWFFDFVVTAESYPCNDERIKDEKSMFMWSNAHDQMQFAQGFCNLLNDLLDIKTVSEVFITCDGFYENAWNDFVIRGKTATVFIHLGVSD